MSEPFGAGDSGQGDYTGGQGEGQQGINPAWNDLLGVVPQELHSQVTPHLQNWDRNVQQRFEKVQSEYEPWKPVIGSGFNPEDAQFALNLLNALQSNPRDVYDRLGEYYKFNNPDGLQGQGQGEPPTEDNPYAKDIAELRQQNQQLAELMYQQRQAEMAQQADSQLDAELSALKQKYGDYNEKFVVAQMMAGTSAEEAVQQYFAWRDQELQRNIPKPLILGAGGSVPNGGIDPRKLDDKGTKSLIVDMLKAAQQQQ